MAAWRPHLHVPIGEIKMAPPRLLEEGFLAGKRPWIVYLAWPLITAHFLCSKGKAFITLRMYYFQSPVSRQRYWEDNAQGRPSLAETMP